MQDWDSGFFKFPSHSYSRPGEYEREKGVCSRSTERGSTHWLLGSAQGRPGRCIGANPGSVFAFLLQLRQGAFLFPQSPRRHFTSPPYPWRGAGEAAEQKRRVTRPLTFGGWAPHLLSLLAERAQDPPSSARAGATAPGAQDSTPGREVTGPGHSPLGGHRARGVPSFGDSASRAAQGLTC